MAYLSYPTAWDAIHRLASEDEQLAVLRKLIDQQFQRGGSKHIRGIFYPIMSWSDVSAGGQGLRLITHGLQGLGGMSTLDLLLGRQVTDPDGEGLTDPAYHTLRYAYMPNAGSAADARPWLPTESEGVTAKPLSITASPEEPHPDRNSRSTKLLEVAKNGSL